MRTLLVVAGLLAWSVAPAQERKASELADLSLEELANIEVTTVSRRAERLVDAPASVFVITQEEIRRSGVTSLPEALRLAPNLQVARVDARQYAISARGFNNTIANKLLVLVDGRTVYTPLFSGVFWDEQDVFLEDVERIEVISGPGATLWGSNAVNGVINVITRRATDTRGVLAFAGAGNLEKGIGARYGTSLAGGGLRIYAKAADRDHTVRGDDSAVSDGWRNSQAGFRADWGDGGRSFTLQGDAYRGRIDQAADDIRTAGGNLLARWTRQSPGGGRLQVQSYFDYRDREIPGSITEHLGTFDIDLQHALQPRAGHLLTWGVGHRRASDEVINTNAAVLAFLPEEKELRWSNAFAQDEVELRGNLRLTLGAKIERNPYTGNEFLPSARLAWKPGAERTVWASASRAVRAPARLDRELFIFMSPQPIAGGPGFRSETSEVLELGYRAQPSLRTSYSVTVFHSRHDHLRSIEPIGGGNFVIGNEMEGDSTGLETWASWQPAAPLRLRAGGLLLDQDLRLKPGSGDPTGPRGAGNDPKRQFMLRASVDLPRRQDLDVLLRHVGRLPNPEVPSYTALDLRYALALQRALELSLTLQNVLDRRHPEFGQPATRSELQRGAFLKVQWQP